MTGAVQPYSLQASDDELAVRIIGEEEFSTCTDSWNGLLEVSASESFFLKWEWLYTFWETIERKDASLQVCFCLDGVRLVGIAPLYSYSSTLMGIPVRKIAFLGDRVASDYLDVFTLPGYEERCCSAVLETLQSTGSAGFTLFEFDGVCADANIYSVLGELADAVVLPRFDCPRARLPTSLDEFLARLSASSRYYLGRKQRKLEKQFPDIEVRHARLSDAPELLDVLFDLHEKRWQTLENRHSTFSTDYRKSFNDSLLGRVSESDGFFSSIWINGHPVSIMYSFLYKKHAFFYQNGWDPEYAPYSIGIYNIQEALRYAIRNGCRTFDFLRGPERYKYMFCNDVRQACAILLFSESLKGRFLKGLVCFKQVLKKLLGR